MTTENPATETAEIKPTDTPEKESDSTTVENQETETTDFYAQFIEGTEETSPSYKAAEKKSEVKSEEDKTDEEKEAEAKKKEETTEPEYEIADDKLLIKTGDKTEELVKHDFGNGVYGFIPESQKNGFLMQADYTQKTQKLADEKKAFETEKESYAGQKKELETLRYVDLLGGDLLEPVLREMGDENAVPLLDTEGKSLGKMVYNDFAEYTKAVTAYNTQKADKAVVEARRTETKRANSETLGKFKEKYGEEALKNVTETLGNFIGKQYSYIARELTPYPEEVLEIARKGLYFDSELQKAVAAAKLEKVAELNNKKDQKPSNQNQQTKIPVKKSNVPDRYAFVDEDN